MESVIEVLMNRDGFTREEAEKEYKCGMELVMEDITQGDFEIAQQDFEEEAFFENACDCLYYGYGFKTANKCGLSEERAKEIWRDAFNYMATHN